MAKGYQHVKQLKHKAVYVGDTRLIVLVNNWLHFPLFTSLLQFDTPSDYADNILRPVFSGYRQVGIKE